GELLEVVTWEAATECQDPILVRTADVPDCEVRTALQPSHCRFLNPIAHFVDFPRGCNPEPPDPKGDSSTVSKTFFQCKWDGTRVFILIFPEVIAPITGEAAHGIATIPARAGPG